MNQSKTNSFSRWNDVNLRVLVPVRTVRILCVLGWNLCENYEDSLWFTLVVNLEVFPCLFQTVFRVMVRVWTERLELAMDSHRLRLCSDFSTWLKEIWELLESVIRRFWFVPLILWFGSLLVSFLSSSLISRCDPSLLSLSSSLISWCDHACSALLPVACSRLDCSFTSSMMKVLMNLWELAGKFVWICCHFDSV